LLPNSNNKFSSLNNVHIVSRALCGSQAWSWLVGFLCVSVHSLLSRFWLLCVWGPKITHGYHLQALIKSLSSLTKFLKAHQSCSLFWLFQQVCLRHQAINKVSSSGGVSQVLEHLPSKHWGPELKLQYYQTIKNPKKVSRVFWWMMRICLMHCNVMRE
jgi:hypothetical protein